MNNRIDIEVRVSQIGKGEDGVKVRCDQPDSKCHIAYVIYTPCNQIHKMLYKLLVL